MKLVVTIVGKDRVGIIAMVSNILAENNVNILNINQNIMGLSYHLSKGASRTIVGVIGDKKVIADLQMNAFEGVEKTVRITEKYKLVSREFKPENTIVDVGGVKIGGPVPVVMKNNEKVVHKMDELLYVIPANSPKEKVLSLLKDHPEIKFVSLVGVDLAGNDTDEKIPMKRCWWPEQRTARSV